MIPEKATKLLLDIQMLKELSLSSPYDEVQHVLDRVSGKLIFYGLFYEREIASILSSASAKFRIGRYSKEKVLQIVNSVNPTLIVWMQILVIFY